MPRRNQATIRPLEPDSVYRSRLVQQIVNKVMQNGKKSLAEQITYDALALVGERTGSNPVDELEGDQAAHPCARGAFPPGRRGDLPGARRGSSAARADPGGALAGRVRPRPRRKSMAERLANEILDASKQQGNAWKRKDDIYRMAQANKAFAHYRW